jgi:MoaA/NifB/PqqE/SkfB family radical SAM enzyme
VFRRAYLDILKNKTAEKGPFWIFRQLWHYFLIKLSFLLRRPLCGPVLGTIIVTYKCNFKCRMCDFPAGRQKEAQKEELPLDRLKQAIRELALLGVSGIGFTGGEPLLRNDIFELLKYTKGQGVITHLNTNGFLLDAEAARKIVGSGTDSVNISLDGAKAETHDNIRAVTGAFGKALNAINCLHNGRSLAGSRLRIKIVSVISAANIAEVPGLLELSKRAGVDCIEFVPEQRFSDSCVTDTSEGFAVKLKQAVDFIRQAKKAGAKIENSWQNIKLFERSLKGSKSLLTCYAGYNSCCLDCYGNIFPCIPWANWRRPAANINAGSLKEIWYSEGYNKIRHSTGICRDCFLNCHAELNHIFNLI